MSYIEDVKNFNKQFSYIPELVNKDKIEKKDKFLIAGMGGSNLVADLIRVLDPGLDIKTHKDYGLSEVTDRQVIISSYSGNTKETISALERSISENLNPIIISSGGKILEKAKEKNLAYIELPNTASQQRIAVGYSVMGTLKAIGREDLLKKASELAENLNPLNFKEQGKELAEKIIGKIPVIYSSVENLGIAYNWKIKFNETGKTPAFYNVFPELCHNEIEGTAQNNISKNLFFIFLKDLEDNKESKKDMDIVTEIYKNKGLEVEEVNLETGDVFYKIFSSLVLADWTSYYLAESEGKEPGEVPTIKEFKSKL